MEYAHMIVSKDFKKGKISDRLYGSFVEHMGSVVYNGIFEPGHPESDENGFRKDVIKLVKELNLSVIRYPGGNFSSGYNWEDGIGPKENRPIRLDLAWRAYEPNTFGLNEFMLWIKKIGAAPVMTINLGTRGIDAARNIVEYCNFPGGSYWSDLRKTHGFQNPHNIKVWCLGNELDGEWQIGHKTAEEYGRLACETAKAMKWLDPEIELVAVGSSARHMPTFPEWDETVLMHTYEQVEYLSLHKYIDKEKKDTASYLAAPIDMEMQIKDIIATCDYVKAKKRSNKKMYLSFDEWNVHRPSEIEYIPWQTGSPCDWSCFTMEDTLVFGSMLLTLIRNADRVKMACQSLLVNTIPLVLTEKGGKAWRNPTFYPFMHASLFGRGEVLVNVIDTPKYDTPDYNDVPIIDSVAVLNEEKGELTVFAINRSEEAVMLSIDARDFKNCKMKEHIVLKHDNLNATNTSEKPFEICPVLCSNTRVDDGRVESVLDRYSWNVMRFGVMS
jgi:alpha-N-arabinofuranosidase